MRKNAAMRADEDSRMAGWAALAPVVLAAVAVLVIALVVRGSKTGTIVVQKIVLSGTTIQNGQENRPRPFAISEITETSVDGTAQREFTSNSFSRPGFEQVVSGQSIQLYDPLDHTIFETTEAAEQRAVDEEMGLSEPNRTRSSTASSVQYARFSFVPGLRSVFEQQVLAHQYRVAGRQTIDGRPVLKLVPVRVDQLLPAHHRPGSYASLGTAYVSPRTYDPIEQVIRTKLPGVVSTATVRWRLYRVLPATSANQRLLSLTALHPQARIVENARAFLRATQSEQPPTRTLGIKKGHAPTLSSTASGRPARS